MPSIVIVGASSDRRKYGNKATRAFAQGGWTVYPVNPRAEVIEGLSAYKRIADVPTPVDRVSLYVPPEAALGLVDEIAGLAPTEVFLNPGSESAALIEALQVRGLEVVQACSIVNLGLRPEMFPDE